MVHSTASWERRSRSAIVAAMLEVVDKGRPLEVRQIAFASNKVFDHFFRRQQGDQQLEDTLQNPLMLLLVRLVCNGPVHIAQQRIG